MGEADTIRTTSNECLLPFLHTERGVTHLSYDVFDMQGLDGFAAASMILSACAHLLGKIRGVVALGDASL